jgi:acetylornithine/succinyldiaminopimelate/putrescine aminotransferase
MPRFYLDVTDSAFPPDEIGDRFETIEAARAAALAILSDIIQEEVPAKRARIRHSYRREAEQFDRACAIHQVARDDGWMGIGGTRLYWTR